jgi:hypothetical protein
MSWWIPYVFKGYNEDGVAVYETYHDKYLANQAALEELHNDQLNIATAIDAGDRAGEDRANRDEPHAVPGHWFDDNQQEQPDLPDSDQNMHSYFHCTFYLSFIAFIYLSP